MYFSPSLPMVSMTIWSSTNSTAVSTKFCDPVGTSAFFLVPRTKMPMVSDRRHEVDEDDLVDGPPVIGATDEVGPVDDVSEGRELESEH